MNLIVSVSDLLKVYPEFDSTITGIIRNISELSIGASILYILFILLFLALIINLVLNKFAFDSSKKQKILIGFCLLFAIGAGVTKYEMNSAFELDQLRIKVLTHLHEENEIKSSYPVLIKNIADCSEGKLNKLSSKYVHTFRRKFEDSEYYIYLVSKKTLDLLREKSLSMTKDYLSENKDVTVSDLRAAAKAKGFVKIDSSFISAFLDKYPDWMIEEVNGDSVLVKRPPPRLEETMYESIGESHLIDLKGPKNKGY